jgi:hypothetical protein
MDASQYMRRLRESCPKTIARNQCVDASTYTQMKGLAAATTFVGENSRNANTFVAACNTSSVAQGGTEVTPVLPAPACVSQGICDFTNTRYADGTRSITIPGCPYNSTIAAYTPVCKVTPYCATPSQKSAASQRVADRELGVCCDR